MRAQDDSAEEPLRAERRQVKPAEDCFPGDCLTTRAPEGRHGSGQRPLR